MTGNQKKNMMVFLSLKWSKNKNFSFTVKNYLYGGNMATRNGARTKKAHTKPGWIPRKGKNAGKKVKKKKR